jgi:hypothetical protein
MSDSRDTQASRAGRLAAAVSILSVSLGMSAAVAGEAKALDPTAVEDSGQAGGQNSVKLEGQSSVKGEAQNSVKYKGQNSDKSRSYNWVKGGVTSQDKWVAGGASNQQKVTPGGGQ